MVRPPALPDLGQHLRRPRRRAGVVVGRQGGPPRRRRRGDAGRRRPTSRCPTARPAWVDGGPRTPLAARPSAVVHSESVDLGRLAVVPPRGRAARRPGRPTSSPPSPTAAARPGSSPRPARARPGCSPSACATSTSTAATSRRRVLAVAYNKQAQLEMEARTTDFRPRVRTLNSLGLWVLAEHRGGVAARARRARGAAARSTSLLPGRRQRRANTDPDRPVRRGADVDPPRPPRPRGGRGVARRRPGPRRAVPGVPPPARRARRRRLRRADLRRRRGAARRRRRSAARCSARAATSSSTSSRTSRRPTCCCVRLLAAARRSTCSASATTTSASTATPAPTRRSSSTTSGCSPAPSPHPLTVNYRCPVEVVDGARTLLGYNHRRVAKQIDAGPASDTTAGALRVVEHGRDDGADGAGRRRARAGSTSRASTPSSIAVLARVNSLLLAPHVALHEAGVPVVVGAAPRRARAHRHARRPRLPAHRRRRPTAMAAGDIVEILRRPTRGLPQWFPERLRAAVAVDARPARGARRPGAGQGRRQGAAPRRRPAASCVDAGRAGTTRDVLEAVRDDVGLGAAMSLLDRTGGGQGSSHLDDLDGLLGVADLHPDPAGFEPWLRAAFQREADPARRHAVDDPPGEGPGVGPRRRVRRHRRHRAAPPGRGRRGGAPRAARRHHPRPPPRRRARRPHPPAARSSPSSPARHRSRRRTPVRDGRRRDAAPRRADDRRRRRHRGRAGPRASRCPAATRAPIEEVDGRSALVRAGVGRHAARPLRRAGRARRPAGAARRADRAVGRRGRRPRRRCGRGAPSARSADGVPAYVVVNDKHLRGIALARPTTPAELVGLRRHRPGQARALRRRDPRRARTLPAQLSRTVPITALHVHSGQGGEELFATVDIRRWLTTSSRRRANRGFPRRPSWPLRPQRPGIYAPQDAERGSLPK